MAYKADDRPLAEEVLQHPWFGSPTDADEDMPTAAHAETRPLDKPFSEQVQDRQPSASTVPDVSMAVTSGAGTQFFSATLRYLCVLYTLCCGACQAFS